MNLRYFLLLNLLVLCGLATPAAAQLYDVRTSSVNYERRERAAVKVQVEATASWVQNFFQDWMKDNYNIRFKGGGLLGRGKADVLKAKQTPATTISGKLVDLYATVVAPADTVSEVAVFGAFDDHSFFDANKTPTEFSALRTITQSFANAARLKVYREQVADAEDRLKKAEKDRDRLNKSTASAKSNTTSNLAKIDALLKQNEANRLQISQDSASFISNATQRDEAGALLQRRRDRLSALERK